MSVTRIVIYRVEVKIPDDIWFTFKRELEYDQRVIKAITGYLTAGADSYSDVYEWAEFENEKQARECERKLLEMVEYFKNKLDDKDQSGEQE